MSMATTPIAPVTPTQVSGSRTMLVDREGENADGSETPLDVARLLQTMHMRPTALAESWGGCRPYNEDRYITGVDIGPLGHFFAVYDGHGGTDCADFLTEHLHRQLQACFTLDRAEMMALENADKLEAMLKDWRQSKAQLKDLNELIKQMEDQQDADIVATKEQLEQLMSLQAEEMENLRLDVAKQLVASSAYEKATTAAIYAAFEICDDRFRVLNKGEL